MRSSLHGTSSPYKNGVEDEFLGSRSSGYMHKLPIRKEKYDRDLNAWNPDNQENPKMKKKKKKRGRDTSYNRHKTRIFMEFNNCIKEGEVPRCWRRCAFSIYYSISVYLYTPQALNIIWCKVQ